MFGFKRRRLIQAQRDALAAYDEAVRGRTAALSRLDNATERKDTRGIRAARVEAANATMALPKIELGR